MVDTTSSKYEDQTISLDDNTGADTSKYHTKDELQRQVAELDEEIKRCEADSAKVEVKLGKKILMCYQEVDKKAEEVKIAKMNLKSVQDHFKTIQKYNDERKSDLIEARRAKTETSQ